MFISGDGQLARTRLSSHQVVVNDVASRVPGAAI